MVRWQTIALAVCALGGGLVPTHARAQLLPPGTKATLDVEYAYSSSGRQSTPNDQYDWQVNRKVAYTVQLVADKPSPYAGFLPATAADKKDLDQRQARSASSLQKAAPMMADIQKLMAKCGEDAACIERETTKLAGSMDKAAIRSAGADAAAAGTGFDNHYQLWKPVSHSGTYSADELHVAAVADPDCLKAPKMQCVSQQAIKGKGALSQAGTGPLEVDGPGKRLHINLLLSGGAMPVTRSVTGKVQDGVKAGSFPDNMRFAWARIKPLVVAIPNGLDKASGTEKIKIDGERGESGTLTISWLFKLAR
jgi:hypothetical protein